ncbi:Zinc finger FYVE domain-containing protein 1 [Pseudolycoriella hygida]|uniref:Zinc finger FYVE domain-containing protein 1 n=1 Tax=Pseudolycoriella hygida TaxID=35572 RepID=A0A9Q0MRD9_9DIPT|nr:Zinc finger FYVE domain-containing protein 1 [Pseudolycoriella hygida]
MSGERDFITFCEEILKNKTVEQNEGNKNEDSNRNGARDSTLLKKLLAMKYHDGKDMNELFRKFDEDLNELKAMGADLNDEKAIKYLLLSLPKSYNNFVAAVECLDHLDLPLEFVKKRLWDEYIKRKEILRLREPASLNAAYEINQQGNTEEDDEVNSDVQLDLNNYNYCNVLSRKDSIESARWNLFGSDLDDAIQTDILGDALSDSADDPSPQTNTSYIFQRPPEKLNTSPDEMKSINMHYQKSFLLMDSTESLCVPTGEIFCKKLGCGPEARIKVVSIFGNTGDGKSHTMNNLFFDDATEEVFRTSQTQESCTMGVWAAYQPAKGVLCLDTEGLLGSTADEDIRMRMLMKLMAISDICIYRTKSERLHNDMFKFLGIASEAFCNYFSTALQSLELPGSAQTLGPAIIIFHETTNTKVVEACGDKCAEDILRERFAAESYSIDAFSSIKYGIIAVDNELRNTTVRSRRHPEVVFTALEAINNKFSGRISRDTIIKFPEQYFTCGAHCESCELRCVRSMGHVIEGKEHHNSENCSYRYQYQNRVYLCKQCLKNGRKVIVTLTTQTTNDTLWYGLAKYAWSGSVIECPNCGVIYKSRKYWYGNELPEDQAVGTEIIHVWKNEKTTSDGPTHSAQIALDGMNYLSETVTRLSAQPLKAVTDFVADRTAPSYWRPNCDIIICFACKTNFERNNLRKHHCRGCGEGFCNQCSSNKMPVPSRGWMEDVRVCDACKNILLSNRDACPGSDDYVTDDQDVRLRRYGEVFLNTFSTVRAVLDYPIDYIKDSARPSYWVPDSEAPNCSICKLMFGTAEEFSKKTDQNYSTTSRADDLFQKEDGVVT